MKTPRLLVPAAAPGSTLGLTRRDLVAAGAALVAAPAIAQRRRPTPAQTEGPFYPVRLPEDSDADLLQRAGRAPYRHGEPALVEGVVLDLQGRPLAGAQIEIWQCDHQGYYHHPGDGDRADPDFQGFGRAVADARGHWRFRTLRPVPYGGRTPHIHVKVRQGARELLTTQLYVAGEPRNERDFLWRSLSAEGRAALTRPFARSADGWHTEFPIYIDT